MINKIAINQDNYEKILEIAKTSNSIHDLCSKLGWKNESIKKRLKKLLLTNNFDIAKFPKLHAENSVFNNKLKLSEVVKNSFSYTQVIQNFVNKVAAGHYITLKRYIKKFELDISHFSPYRLGKSNKQIINEQMFISNSLASSRTVRLRLIKDNLIPYKCKCGNEGEWQGQTMTLQLDHKNGDRTDQRLENLEFLCPNCHSLTVTWGSRNKISNKRTVEVKKEEKLLRNKNNLKTIKVKKIEDSKELILNTIYQYDNLTEILVKLNLTKNTLNYNGLKNFLEANKTPEVIEFLKRADKTVSYPPLKKLKKEVAARGYEAIGRDLNCSGNAIKSHIKKHTKKIVPYPELDELNRLIKNSSYIQVAKDLNCTESALRKHLIRNDENYVKEIKKQISYPSLPDLITLISEKGYVQVGKELGCSDNAIRKYLKKNGIDTKSLNSNLVAV